MTGTVEVGAGNPQTIARMLIQSPGFGNIPEMFSLLVLVENAFQIVIGQRTAVGQNTMLHTELF